MLCMTGEVEEEVVVVSHLPSIDVVELVWLELELEVSFLSTWSGD